MLFIVLQQADPQNISSSTSDTRRQGAAKYNCCTFFQLFCFPPCLNFCVLCVTAQIGGCIVEPRLVPVVSARDSKMLMTGNFSHVTDGVRGKVVKACDFSLVVGCHSGPVALAKFYNFLERSTSP